jgi:hypothetical protein
VGIWKDYRLKSSRFGKEAQRHDVADLAGLKMLLLMRTEHGFDNACDPFTKL